MNVSSNNRQSSNVSKLLIALAVIGVAAGVSLGQAKPKTKLPSELIQKKTIETKPRPNVVKKEFVVRFNCLDWSHDIVDVKWAKDPKSVNFVDRGKELRSLGFDTWVRWESVGGLAVGPVEVTSPDYKVWIDRRTSGWKERVFDTRNAAVAFLNKLGTTPKMTKQLVER